MTITIKNNVEISDILLDEFIDYTLRRLFGAGYKYADLNIVITFKTCPYFGICWYEDNTAYIDVNLGLNFHHILTTIAHELVHVKQFFFREMIILHGGTTWHGCLFMESRYNEDAWLCKTPWEIEAYKLEKSIKNNFYETP